MQKLDRTVVGDAVNVGSRLEQLTKVYAVDMIASEDFILNIPGYQYARVIDSLYVKGKTTPIKIYEIFEHNHAEVIDFKIGQMSKISDAVELKVNGQYADALMMLKEVIKTCPKHRLRPDQLLDPFLTSFKSSLEKQILY